MVPSLFEMRPNVTQRGVRLVDCPPCAGAAPRARQRPSLCVPEQGAFEIGVRSDLERLSRLSRFFGTGDISGLCSPRAV